MGNARQEDLDERYTHGHHESVLRSHRWRTVENSSSYLAQVLTPGDLVLDLGCGPGNLTADLAEKTGATVIGLDNASAAIAAAHADFGAHQGVAFCVGDGYRLPFADNTFAATHAHQVLQHSTKPLALLGELYRVTKPGGALGVRDATYSSFRWSPQSPGLDRWLALYLDLARKNQGEPDAETTWHRGWKLLIFVDSRSQRPRGPTTMRTPARGGVACGPTGSCPQTLDPNSTSSAGHLAQNSKTSPKHFETGQASLKPGSRFQVLKFWLTSRTQPHRCSSSPCHRAAGLAEQRSPHDGTESRARVAQFLQQESGTPTAVSSSEMPRLDCSEKRKGSAFKFWRSHPKAQVLSGLAGVPATEFKLSGRNSLASCRS